MSSEFCVKFAVFFAFIKRSVRRGEPQAIFVAAVGGRRSRITAPAIKKARSPSKLLAKILNSDVEGKLIKSFHLCLLVSAL